MIERGSDRPPLALRDPPALLPKLEHFLFKQRQRPLHPVPVLVQVLSGERPVVFPPHLPARRALEGDRKAANVVGVAQAHLEHSLRILPVPHDA